MYSLVREVSRKHVHTHNTHMCDLKILKKVPFLAGPILSNKLRERRVCLHNLWRLIIFHQFPYIHTNNKFKKWQSHSEIWENKLLIKIESDRIIIYLVDEPNQKMFRDLPLRLHVSILESPILYFMVKEKIEHTIREDQNHITIYHSWNSMSYSYNCAPCKFLSNNFL